MTGEERYDGPLPEPVRARVLTLAAEGLGRMPVDHVPPSLKRVASFAPTRRAKLASAQIAGVLETDETFREHLAIQVRTTVAELARALDEGVLPPAADPVEVAAVAYLLRPAGWSKIVAEASAHEVPVESAAHSDRSDRLDRLGRQLDQAQQELRTLRGRHREQLAEIKTENADLRRKLGETRTRLRSAQVGQEDAEEVAAAAASAATKNKAAVDAELRRLRARIEELDAELAAVRRSERVNRDGAALRARLLLDTLIDSAGGLRRELALPTVAGSPADAVEAHVAEQGSRTPSGHGSLTADDPALLDHLLALPRAHLVVDGYNVTKNAWPELSLEQQRDRLVAAMGPLTARTRAEVTVVFDAAETTTRPMVRSPRGVRVLFSPPGVIADDVIRDLVAAEPAGRAVVVVTSDQAIVRDVHKAGFRTVGWGALARLLARS